MCIHSLMQLTVSHCDVNREEKCSDPVFMTGELDDCRTIVKVYRSSLIFLFRWFFSLHRNINLFSRERIKEEEKKRKWCSDVENQWRGSLSVSSLWPLAAVVRSKFLDRCRCVVASCQTHLLCVSPPLPWCNCGRSLTDFTCEQKPEQTGRVSTHSLSQVSASAAARLYSEPVEQLVLCCSSCFFTSSHTNTPRHSHQPITGWQRVCKEAFFFFL